MTYVGTENFPRMPLVPGQAFGRIDDFFNLLSRSVGSEYLDEERDPAAATRNPVEERLKLIQDTISHSSMHLPSGFAPGLNRQFANLMDVDAWEPTDSLICMEALTAFLLGLVTTDAQRRPGIGTNGVGSVTAAWTQGDNRLTIDYLPSGKASVVLSRLLAEDGELERAAFGAIHPSRLADVLVPFAPEVWFDN